MPAAILRRGQRLLEVGPELLDVLEPDAEPQQVLRHAIALPAIPGLDDGVDAAEARCVLDQPRRGLDRARVTGDVEREEAAETAAHEARGAFVTEAGVAHALDARVRAEAPRELERARRLPLDAQPQGLQTAQHEPGRVRCG